MGEHWSAARSGRHRRPGTDSGMSGFGFVMVAVSMLITAALVVLLLKSFAGDGSSSDNPNDSPGIQLADDLQAKQTLSSSLTSAQSQAAQAGGYGAVTAAALGADNPGITYTSGASSSPTAVSVASDSTATSGVTGTTSPGGALNPDGSDATPGGGGSGGSGGSVTLASWSTSRTCWLIWQPTGGQPWYGAQTNLPNCTAPAFSAAPTPGMPTSTSIGWQQGSFPAA